MAREKGRSRRVHQRGRGVEGEECGWEVDKISSLRLDLKRFGFVAARSPLPSQPSQSIFATSLVRTGVQVSSLLDKE